MLIENGLTLWMFMSGVFYDITALPERVQLYFRLNPMATLIENYRAVLIHGAWPDWPVLGIIASVSMLGIGAALYLLMRYDRIYPRAVMS